MPDVFVTPSENSLRGVGIVGQHKKLHLKGIPHTHNPLASFNYEPKGVKFIGADEKEQIVLLLRKHPITNVRWVLMAIIMVFVPLLVSFTGALESVPIRFQLVGMLIWYLIVLAFIFEEFLGWYFHTFIITDERVFDVDFVNLAYREISECNIDQIQDVTTKVGGVGRTVFKYGDVFIQTSSENPEIEFEAVPNPDDVSRVLRELRVQEEQEKIEGRVR